MNPHHNYPKTLLYGFLFIFGFISRMFFEVKPVSLELQKDQLFFHISNKKLFQYNASKFNENQLYPVFLALKKEHEIICRFTDNGFFIFRNNNLLFVKIENYQMTERKQILYNFIHKMASQEVFVLSEDHQDLSLCSSSPKISYGILR